MNAQGWAVLWQDESEAWWTQYEQDWPIMADTAEAAVAHVVQQKREAGDVVPGVYVAIPHAMWEPVQRA